MTEYTADAPAPTEPPPDKTLTWWPILGAAVIAVLVAVAIFSFGAGEDNRSGSRVEDDGALACPAGYSRSQPKAINRVPADPSGVDGENALVPNVAPTYLVVCRYVPSKDPGRRTNDIPLDGRVVLTDGQREAARTLNAAPKGKASPSCTPGTGAERDAYLLGFTFSTGVLWVSVPGDDCIVSSNGKFSTTANLAADTAKAYATKVWPTR